MDLKRERDRAQIGKRDRGGQNVPNARGGGTRPESCLCKSWIFEPQIEDFLKKLCRKGSNFGTPKSQNFQPPPLIFGDLTPPYPCLQPKVGDLGRKLSLFSSQIHPFFWNSRLSCGAQRGKSQKTPQILVENRRIFIFTAGNCIYWGPSPYVSPFKRGSASTNLVSYLLGLGSINLGLSRLFVSE